MIAGITRRAMQAFVYLLVSVAPGKTALCERSSGAGNSSKEHMSFDVVSIREKRDGDMSFYDNPSDSSYFHAENLTVQGLILSSYQIKTYQQLEHLPGWTTSVRYDITAKGDAATDDALAHLSKLEAQAEKRHMVRQVLAERFHLHIHEETRVATVFDLMPTALMATAMIRVRTDANKTIGNCAGTFSQQGRDIDSKGCPFTYHLNAIEQQFGTTITNKSGLVPEDLYAYHLFYDPRPIPRTDIDAFPTLRTALHDQLGLNLKESKGPLSYWVVDSVDRPTEN